jgi:hypothetical protein
LRGISATESVMRLLADLKVGNASRTATLI